MPRACDTARGFYFPSSTFTRPADNSEGGRGEDS